MKGGHNDSSAGTNEIVVFITKKTGLFAFTEVEFIRVMHSDLSLEMPIENHYPGQEFSPTHPLKKSLVQVEQSRPWLFGVVRIRLGSIYKLDERVFPMCTRCRSNIPA